MARTKPAQAGQALLAQLREEYTGHEGASGGGPPAPRVLASLAEDDPPAQKALRLITPARQGGSPGPAQHDRAPRRKP
jgi:hypothetical protein